jgi:glyoxylase-like metal-dependent hydrolase (beta-lactamase superfamily II)
MNRITRTILFLALLVAPQATAQGTAPPSATRDSATDAASTARAVATLERAVRALGGRAAVLGDRPLDVTLTGWSRNGWQQARRATDTSATNTTERLRWVVDPQRRRAIRESRTTAPGGIRFHFRTAADTAGQFTVDLLRWRSGDDISRGPAAAGRTTLLAAERVFPHLVVRQALGRRETLRAEGETTKGGRRLAAVSWADAAGTRTTMWLDAATGLPAATAPSAQPGGRTHFDDFRLVDGVRIPHRLSTVVDGRTQNELRVTRVAVDAVPDDLFAVPAGYAEAPPAGEPRATPLGGGVFRLDGMPQGYHAAFVVRGDHVAVLEAPQSPQWTEVALRVIAATAPGLPVRTVFVSHHHADHVGGLAPYVSAGATLVVGPGVEDAVRRQLPDSLRGRARFETVDSARSFGEGAARIDAFVVPNTHADGNLAVYVPAAGVLFQGDLFYIPERGDVPPAFPVTEALERALMARGIRPAQIVGVHGRTGTWEELRLSLRRRAEGAR